MSYGAKKYVIFPVLVTDEVYKESHIFLEYFENITAPSVEDDLIGILEYALAIVPSYTF
jgi:hypothetical protein